MTFMQLSVHKIGVAGRDAAGDIAGSIRERQRWSPSLKPPDQHLGIGRGERTQISTLQWGSGGEKWGLWVKVGGCRGGIPELPCAGTTEPALDAKRRATGDSAASVRGQKRQQHLTRR